MSHKSYPKIYLVDIETSPNIGFSWGKWEQNILKFSKEWEILSFAYKELGKKSTYCIARPDFVDDTDKALTKAAWKVLNEADIVIGHNLDAFDNKKLKAKFLEHGLKPPKTYKTIDTLKIARAQFAFNSNSLNDLSATLKVGKKVKTGGIDLWFGCMDGDPKAWAKMIAYNKQDVILLEKVYEALRAWYPAHPNLALYTERPGCPVCTSAHVQRRGTQVLQSRKVARFQCQACGHWFKGSKV
jgi:DNA polymerase elongation subunit (family B)